MEPDVRSQVIHLKGSSRDYQAIAIDTRPLKALISPEAMLSWQIPDDLDLSRGVVLYGNAPNWFYNHALCRLSDAPWVGFFDLRSKSVVVVRSRDRSIAPGDSFPIFLNRDPGTAILIGGPPNSGKSVLSNALRVAVMRSRPDLQVYLHRANWDGEGNYIYESPHRDVVARLKQKNKYKIPDLPNADDVLNAYFQERATDTQNIRQVTDLTLVDVGGVPDEVKLPVVRSCSHYIIISNHPDKVEAWQGLCRDLQPLAVIHSVRETCCEVLRTSPYLESIVGPWEREREAVVPQVLLDSIVRVAGG
ncbi:MAG: CRISPR-associated protein Csx3 [Cyanobacteria bacterium SID2]|nr:CRISPR-associated protein Csx3 [Cyanobacteria bacterium SID2]MBP0004072.1 CRISPR-associated protein Csx3 [Cyanobacteria bacterium SBC]